MSDGAAMLGVERSLLGRRWRARLADSQAGLALAQAIEAPELIGRVLAARGVTADDAPAYLEPTLRRLLPDPLHLRDMEKAVARLAGALEAGEKIAVFGDYDVDGATSAALLSRFFQAVGTAPVVYIPDRLREGYGPNAAAMRQLAGEGVAVVVTVDCGISAFDALADAADAGLDVIVVDHHIAEAKLPRACAVIDPNRLDEESPHRQLAAVGVAFLLVVGLNRRLREAGWYRERTGHTEPDLMQWLDLVALGTVCDVVPLTGVNRAFVRQGLTVMRRRRNAGLRALGDVAGLEEPPGVYHLGFILGPRVNAGGRVGEASLGARLLSTEDEAQAGRDRAPPRCAEPRAPGDRAGGAGGGHRAGGARGGGGPIARPLRPRPRRDLARRRDRHRREPAAGAPRPAGHRRRLGRRHRQGLLPLGARHGHRRRRHRRTAGRACW